MHDILQKTLGLVCIIELGHRITTCAQCMIQSPRKSYYCKVLQKCEADNQLITEIRCLTIEMMEFKR